MAGEKAHAEDSVEMAAVTKAWKLGDQYFLGCDRYRSHANLVDLCFFGFDPACGAQSGDRSQGLDTDPPRHRTVEHGSRRSCIDEKSKRAVFANVNAGGERSIEANRAGQHERGREQHAPQVRPRGNLSLEARVMFRREFMMVPRDSKP